MRVFSAADPSPLTVSQFLWAVLWWLAKFSFLRLGGPGHMPGGTVSWEPLPTSRRSGESKRGCSNSCRWLCGVLSGRVVKYPASYAPAIHRLLCITNGACSWDFTISNNLGWGKWSVQSSPWVNHYSLSEVEFCKKGSLFGQLTTTSFTKTMQYSAIIVRKIKEQRW